MVRNLAFITTRRQSPVDNHLLRSLFLTIAVAGLVGTQAVYGQAISQLVPCKTKVAYQVQSGDLLHVSVAGSPSLDQTVRVSEDGSVVLTLIGDVSLLGLTATEAARTIEASLEKGGFMRRPDVAVLREAYADANITIEGEVGQPGRYRQQADTVLGIVLSQAGGTTKAAGAVTLRRRGHVLEVPCIAAVNADDGDAVNRQFISPGDSIVVNKAPIVYVLGNVLRPGGYRVPENGVTIPQLLALAVGVVHPTPHLLGRIVQQAAQGPSEIRVDLAASQRGTSNACKLSANDILYVDDKDAKLNVSANVILAIARRADIVY